MRILILALPVCSFLLICFPLQILAQCNTTPCTVPVPAINAQDACILPNPQSLNCYYGQTTPDLPQSFPDVWCTTIDNNHWFAFTATSPLAFFIFSVFNCTSGHSIQVGVLSTMDCVNFQTVASCMTVTDQTSQTLIASGLTIGQVYYLCIDGTDGALCEYTINGQNPAINILGSPDVCIPTDPSSHYSTPGGPSFWTINPPGNGVIVGNPVSTAIMVDWLQPGPAEVCAQNVACPNAPLQCVDVWVGGGITEQHVNLCEGKTVSCAGEIFNTPGMYDVHFNGPNNCDSTVRCFVHLIPIDTVVQNRSFCPGDSVVCAGKYFSMPGKFPVTLQTPQGCDSVVNCQIHIIPSDTVHRVVNLCGPSTYPVCDTAYTVTGLYSSICTSSLGCDSIVVLDLAIFHPHAVPGIPGILGCNPGSTVTLFLNTWTQNTAPGGVTLFKWTGPGILGPDNQQTVQVNQPGQYCFVLTHGRDTVFCSDTTCLTVLSAGTAPQPPGITGNQHPCANTSTLYTAIPLGLQLPTSYTWSIPGNVPFSQISPDSILVHWPDTAVSGHICVTANDSCGSSQATCVSVVMQPAASSQTVVICAGETFFVGGAFQNMPGVFLDTLQSGNGCDSIRSTNLVVHPVDTVAYFLTTCIASEAGVMTEVLTQANGCDSLIITTTTLLPVDSIVLTAFTCDPAMVGVFVQNLSNQSGCDSIVTTSVLLSPSDSTFLFASTCDPAMAGIFVQNLSNQFGCDSIVTTSVLLSPSDSMFLTSNTCNAAMAGVFVQNLNNQFGCDSIVTTSVLLSPSDSMFLTSNSCNAAMAGVFVQNLKNQFGCDSIVTTSVTLLPADSTFLSSNTCNAAMAGVFVQNLSNQFGCDSIVITNVSLSPSDSTFLSASTCDTAMTGVFVQNLSNQFGCDSIVITTIDLLPGSKTEILSSTCDPVASGIFTQHFFNQYGCDSTVIVTVVLLPLSECNMEATLVGTDIPCDATTGTLTVTATQGQAPFEYTLLLGGVPLLTGSLNSLGDSEILIGLGPGVYSLHISAANGFNTTVGASIVKLSAPNLGVLIDSDYNGFDISCAGTMDGSVMTTVNGGLPPYKYAWSNGSTTAAVNDLPAGNYSVVVTDANACADTVSVLLSEPAPLNFSFVVNDLNCFGAQNGAILVEANGGVAPYRYALGANTFQNSNLFSNLPAGSYSITTLDANDCQQTEIILVNAAIPVQVDLGDDQTIDLGGTTVLQAIVNLPIDSILSVAWTLPNDDLECPNCLELVVAPFISTTYSVEITALNGCSGKDQIAITVDRSRYLFSPNVFSPNGDGQNDKFGFFPKPGTVKRMKSFQIFDRWGEQVFAVNDYFMPDDNVGWDGYFKGQPLNPGVFIWTINVEFVDGVVESFTGNLTLVR